MEFYNQNSAFLNSPEVKQFINDSSKSLGDIGGGIATASANGIIATGGFIGNMFMAIGMALVIAFWILVALPKIGKEAKRFINPKYSEDSIIWQKSFTQVMTGFIKGTFIQCSIIGVVTGLICWALGIENPGAIGCIVGVVNIIPIFGPIIGLVIVDRFSFVGFVNQE